MRQRPRQLGVDVERKHAALRFGHDLFMREAIEAHQPIRLVEPVFTHHRRRLQRQERRGIRNRAEGRVVNPAHAVSAVKIGAGRQNGDVIGGIGTDDHLRALTRGREARRLGAARCPLRHRDDRGAAAVSCRTFGLVDVNSQPRHRSADRRAVFLRSQRRQPLQCGQFDIDAEPVGIAAGLLQQLG